MKPIIIMLFALTFSACQQKAKHVYIDTSDNVELTDETNDDADYNEVIVPYKEVGGVKIVRVKLNGVELNMIFDTGASTTCISLTEARFLYKNGLLTDDDIGETVQSSVADGRIVENIIINLKEVKLADDLVFTNVLATVVKSTNAPLLLGNEMVLNQVASYKIDNERKEIVFKKAKNQ